MESMHGSSGQGIGFSEDFFQTIFAQAGDGIFLIDEQGRMLEMNPRGCEILGYPKEELVGQPVMRFHPPDEIERTVKGLARLAIDKLVTMESTFIRKDGERISVEITGKLLPDNHIIGLLRDITERKQSEMILRESEEKFRALVEHSPVGIILVDETGHIIEWNLGLEKITGLKRSDALGKPLWQVRWDFQPEGERTEMALTALREDILSMLVGELGVGNEPIEISLHMKEGIQKTIEVVLYTYKTHLGNRMGCILRDVTRRKQIELLLEHHALHDVLTDLPNRRLLQDRLEHGLEQSKRIEHRMAAVMMIDLDHFKEINDTYGHAVGDGLLKIIGQRLQNCLRKSDTAARLGGDEFTLVLVDVKGRESCAVLAQKLLETLSEPVEIEGHIMQVTASIGICLDESDDCEAADLLRRADIALYQAKRYRNSFKFFGHPSPESSAVG